MKNRSLFEEAGYNLTLKLGYSEETVGIVGQLTPGLLSLGAGIWGGFATSAARMNGRFVFVGDPGLTGTGVQGFRAFGPHLLNEGGNINFTRF